jgi:hypothetical protein
MSLEALGGVKWALPVAKELYKNRHQIMSGWEVLLTKFLGPKSSVAFVGPGGIGKSVMLDHITGSALKPNYKPPAQSRRAEMGKAKAEGNRLAIVVAPGQGGPQLDSFENIFDEKKGVDGIVFVAGSGLVSLRHQEAIQQSIVSGFDTIQKWKLRNLEAELIYLNDVARYIRASIKRSRKPKWMLVAATKADLLIDDLASVEKYYSPHGSSAFTSVMNELVEAVGTDNFEWDALPVCSALDNFSWGEEILQSKLDSDARDHFLAQLVARIGEMCR